MLQIINSIEISILENVIYTGFYILGGLLAILLAKQFIKTAVARFDDGNDEVDTAVEQRAKTVGTVMKNAVRTVVWSIVITMGLSKWGVNIAPILAGAGVVGLAVGFGAQSLVKDIVTGFFILFENHMNVGDKVEIAGKKGIVVAMNLRTTILNSEAGEILIIPNAQITTIVRNPA